MKTTKKLAITIVSLAVLIAVVAVAGHGNKSWGQPAEHRSGPSEIVDTYFPGTEPLAPDEMRVVCCGSGLPTPQKAQAATSFLVELGNGDKFIFDLGTESAGNLGCLNIPYDFLNKVFLSHLHSDHAGDLVALWVGGWVSARHGPLQVWGPSGPTPDLGTKAFIDNLKKAWKWDYFSRLGRLPSEGGGLEVHEFDYRGENQVVYDQNGATIRSWPAIHCLDGPVSYSLEWKGLKFVFGGDTFPNKWYTKYGKGADLAIHECFPTPSMLMKHEHLSARAALTIATDIHAVPTTFGMVMDAVKPRMAVAFHFNNTFATRYPVYDGIRQTYKGPLTLCNDLLAWNITKTDIRVRRAIVNEAATAAESPLPPQQSDFKAAAKCSSFVDSGREDVIKVLGPEIEKFKKDHDLK
jgi:ribonuclease Z